MNSDTLNEFMKDQQCILYISKMLQGGKHVDPKPCYLYSYLWHQDDAQHSIKETLSAKVRTGAQYPSE